MGKLIQCDKCNQGTSEKAESRSQADFTETEQFKEESITHDTVFMVKQQNISNLNKNTLPLILQITFLPYEEIICHDAISFILP